MDTFLRLYPPSLKCTPLTIHSYTYLNLSITVKAFYKHSFQRNLLFFIGLGIPSPPRPIRYLPSTCPCRCCHPSTSSRHSLVSHLACSCRRRSCPTPTRKNQLHASYHSSIGPHIDYTSTGKIKVSYAICLSHFSFHFRSYRCKWTHSTTYTTQNPQVSPPNTNPHTNPHY